MANGRVMVVGDGGREWCQYPRCCCAANLPPGHKVIPFANLNNYFLIGNWFTSAARLEVSCSIGSRWNFGSNYEVKHVDQSNCRLEVSNNDPRSVERSKLWKLCRQSGCWERFDFGWNDVIGIAPNQPHGGGCRLSFSELSKAGLWAHFKLVVQWIDLWDLIAKELRQSGFDEVASLNDQCYSYRILPILWSSKLWMTQNYIRSNKTDPSISHTRLLSHLQIPLIHKTLSIQCSLIVE